MLKVNVLFKGHVSLNTVSGMCNAKGIGRFNDEYLVPR